jgi:hypothetical protein
MPRWHQIWQSRLAAAIVLALLAVAFVAGAAALSKYAIGQ